MTYNEKMSWLTSQVRDKINCECYICDFSDESIIVYDYSEGKYYKIPYTINVNEDSKEASFDIDNKVEQVPSYRDVYKVSVDEKEVDIQELLGIYNKKVEEFNTLKSEYENKIYTITIEDKEYNITELNDKYISDINALQDELTNCQNSLNEKVSECDKLCGDLAKLKQQIEEDNKNKLCECGLSMVENESDLDDDDKKTIKSKCENHEYTQVSEIEDDIARALYQKKKNNRSKNFKSIIDAKTNNQNISIFDRL